MIRAVRQIFFHIVTPNGEVDRKKMSASGQRAFKLEVGVRQTPNLYKPNRKLNYLN